MTFYTRAIHKLNCDGLIGIFHLYVAAMESLLKRVDYEGMLEGETRNEILQIRKYCDIFTEQGPTPRPFKLTRVYEYLQFNSSLQVRHNVPVLASSGAHDIRGDSFQQRFRSTKSVCTRSLEGIL